MFTVMSDWQFGDVFNTLKEAVEAAKKDAGPRSNKYVVEVKQGIKVIVPVYETEEMTDDEIKKEVGKDLSPQSSV